MGVSSYVIVRGPLGSNPTFVPADGTPYGTGAQGSDTILYVSNGTNYTDSTPLAGQNYYYIYAMAGATKYGAAAGANALAITICGAAGNGCYDNATAIAAGVAKTDNGKMLTYVYANGSSGFKVWKDQSSNRILRANGLDQWAQNLNINGKGLSGTDFIDPNLGTASTRIEGRVCPPNVYIDDSNKFTSGNCLYYTPTNPQQTLNAAGTSQTIDGQIGITGWIKLWYAGNIQTCSSKGMRPSTIFETSYYYDPATSASFPFADGTPVWAHTTSSGVPQDPLVSLTWTASGRQEVFGHYLLFSCFNYCTTMNTVVSSNMYYSSYYVRCVLP
jgi:hypothetical protein